MTALTETFVEDHAMPFEMAGIKPWFESYRECLGDSNSKCIRLLPEIQTKAEVKRRLVEAWENLESDVLNLDLLQSVYFANNIDCHYIIY